MSATPTGARREARTRRPAAARGRAGAGLAGLLAAALLAACAPELPEPEADAPPETPPPALDEERLARVLDEVETAVAEADAERDPELLGTRVVGPAAQTREAQYRLLGGEDEPAPFATEPQLAAVAASEAWPRPAMVATVVPEGANLPLLLGLEQQGPRDPYALWGWAELFPGAEIPAMARPETGSPVVPADAEGLAAAPEEVLEQYAAALRAPDSDAAERFAADPYREINVRERRVDSLREDLEGYADVEVTSSVGDRGVLALGTGEEGALVMGEVRWRMTVTRTDEAATITLGPPFDQLAEDTDLVGSLDALFEVTVAFHVPAADAEDTTIEPLGATEVLLEVSRDDEAGSGEDSEAEEQD